MSEEDEIVGDLDRMVRAGVMAGAQLAERVQRRRAEAAREAAAEGREQQRRHEEQVRAHRDVARAVHGQAQAPEFWAKATPERIGLSFAAAYEWREHDPMAQASLEALKVGLQEHHSVDVDKVLRRGMEELDAEQRAVAETVLGRYAPAVGPADARPEEAKRERGEAVTQGLVDGTSKRADESASTAQDRERAQAHEDQARAMDDAADESQRPAGELLEEVYQRFAVETQAYVEHDQSAEEGPVLPLARMEYKTYRPGEAQDASPAAEEARMDAGKSFPTSAQASLRNGRTARARVVRQSGTGPGRAQELGR